MGKTYGDDYNEGFEKFVIAGTALSLGSMLVGGIGEGIAKLNEKKAEEIYYAAKGKYMSSVHVFEQSTEKVKRTVKDVVCLKKKIMCNYMKYFLKAYKRLDPNMTLQDSQGLDELRKFVFEQEDFVNIKNTIDIYRSFNERRLGEKAADVALVMVQNVMEPDFANCVNEVIHATKTKDYERQIASMDELRIQSIGVIAEFSVEAVLFGISGISNAFSAGKTLNSAKEAAVQFERQKEKIEINNVKVNAIGEYANIHLKLLERFIPMLEEYVSRATRIIKRRDNIFHIGRIPQRKFTQDELEVLAFTMTLAQAAKTVVDSPIISQSGNVFNGDRSKFNEIENGVGNFERKCIEMRA